MHIVGLKYYDAETARNTGALVPGAKVSFRYETGSKKHPESYVAYCGGLKIGNMPLFGLKVLAAANCPSPVTSIIRHVSDNAVRMSVIVDVEIPLVASPEACRLTKPSTELSGVYAIVNTKNMKAYIGRTRNCNTRRTQHLKRLNNGTHGSPDLQRDWDADAVSFAFVILDTAPPDLDEQERHRKYIYGTEDPAAGYNQGKGFSPPVQPRQHSGGWQHSLSDRRDYFAPRQEEDEHDADKNFSITQTRSPAAPTKTLNASSHNLVRTPSTPSPINQQSGCLLFVAFFLGCICVTLGVLMLATFA